MEANEAPEALPASLHDVAAVLIVRHLENHRPEVVVRCLFDSYQRVGGGCTVAEQRVRDAERLAQRRLVALVTGGTVPLPRRRTTPQAWRPSQSRVAL
ncbi:MAG TPA: hypothetical protein VH134_00275 [Candidatus Dormibacteraeota bacterium]|jgi:hypothetical protein|nr:hypothetical protein [Candidatus Dormibacteraeota bacterium]